MEIEEDVRTVYKVGEALVIALPRKYIRAHKLKAGDKVHVIFNDFLHLKPINPEKLARKAEQVKKLLESE